MSNTEKVEKLWQNNITAMYDSDGRKITETYLTKSDIFDGEVYHFDKDVIFNGNITTSITENVTIADQMVELAKRDSGDLNGFAGFYVKTQFDANKYAELVVDKDGVFYIGDSSVTATGDISNTSALKKIAYFSSSSANAAKNTILTFDGSGGILNTNYIIDLVDNDSNKIPTESWIQNTYGNQLNSIFIKADGKTELTSTIPFAAGIELSKIYNTSHYATVPSLSDDKSSFVLTNIENTFTKPITIENVYSAASGDIVTDTTYSASNIVINTTIDSSTSTVIASLPNKSGRIITDGNIAGTDYGVIRNHNSSDVLNTNYSFVEISSTGVASVKDELITISTSILNTHYSDDYSNVPPMIAAIGFTG